MDQNRSDGFGVWWRELRDSHTDFSILIAGSILLLILAEPVLLKLLGWFAPGLHAQALSLDPSTRRWWFGLPPALLLVLGVPWLQWRRWRRARNTLPANELPATEVLIEESECAALLEKVAALRAQIPRPPVNFSREQYASLHLWEGRFDPHRWFEVFPRVQIADGWRLDFVYQHWGNGGSPKLYLRHENGPRLSTVDQIGSTQWLSKISFEPSAAGFFEFLLFTRVAARFYLHWHSMADDLEYLCTRAQLERSLDSIPLTPPTRPDGPPQMPGGLTAQARAPLLDMDLRPRLLIRGKQAELKILSFTQFGGFSRHRLRITWPNQIEALERIEVVRYVNPMKY